LHAAAVVVLNGGPHPIDQEVPMAITGAHVLFYTPEADALRQMLGDALGWSHVDAGEGWLIFALPPAELGVHPAEAPSHQLSLMCDDLTATVEELRGKGVEFSGEPRDMGWGVAITMTLPGKLELMLYEPRHPTAI
jgi:hypothetical protein